MRGILARRIRFQPIGVALRLGLAPSLMAMIGLAPIFGAGTEARGEVLRWKFKAGEKLVYTMDQKTVTTMKIMGQEAKTTLSQTINMHWDVKSLTSDGGAQVSQTIDRFRTKIESPSLPFEFDTNDKKDPEGPVATTMVPLLRAMVGAEFTMKMNPNGELTDIQVPEKLLNTIRNAGPAGGGMFSEEGLKSMLAQSSFSFPNESLEKGKGWTRHSKIPTPAIGTLVLEKDFTFQGPDPKHPMLVSIDLVTKVALEPSADANVSIKISSQNGKGSFLFNPETGHMETSIVKDTMVMSISAMGQTIDQTTETDTVMKLDK
jgi:hypothetical protein